MLRSVSLLLSLVPVLQTFTDFSLNPHLISNYYIDKNKFHNSLETMIVQRNVGLPTIQKEGFVFQHKGCERLSSDLMRCNFVVNNQRQRRTLSIFRNETRIIDGAGNEFIALEVSLGAKKNTSIFDGRSINYAASNELSTNAPMNGSAIFRGSIANKIVLFDIYTGDFHIEFNTEVNAKTVSSIPE